MLPGWSPQCRYSPGFLCALQTSVRHQRAGQASQGAHTSATVWHQEGPQSRFCRLTTCHTHFCPDTQGRQGQTANHDLVFVKKGPEPEKSRCLAGRALPSSQSKSICRILKLINRPLQPKRTTSPPTLPNSHRRTSLLDFQVSQSEA